METSTEQFINKPNLDTFIILLLFVLIQGATVWYFAYVKVKGEYKALKQEIASIKKIENNLTALLQNKISFNTEQRNAVLNYFKVAHQLFAVLASSTKDIQESKIDAREFGLKNLAQIHKAESELMLFVEDAEVNILAAEIQRIVVILNNKFLDVRQELSLNEENEDKFVEIFNGYVDELNHYVPIFQSLTARSRIIFRRILKESFED